jgi:hypothetical protein
MVKKLLTPFAAILAIVLFALICIYFCLEYLIVCFIRIIRCKKIESLTDYLEKEFSHEEY